eukprot:m.262929 g.262929  ORF g.262929 m.262929 type:complete len:59 (-) comp19703_c0_seq1:1133-1309(-)
MLVPDDMCHDSSLLTSNCITFRSLENLASISRASPAATTKGTGRVEAPALCADTSSTS